MVFVCHWRVASAEQPNRSALHTGETPVAPSPEIEVGYGRCGALPVELV